MIRYKIDLIEALKAKGFSSYRLRKEKLIGEATLTKIRAGGFPSWHEMDILCGLLNLQPGDIIEYAPDVETASK